MRDPTPGSREWGFYFFLAAIGFEMVVPIGIGMFLDRRYGFSPWATLVGAVLGFIVGIMHTMTLLGKRNDGASGKDTAS